jgi:hypothetical protein
LASCSTSALDPCTKRSKTSTKASSNCAYSWKTAVP